MALNSSPEETKLKSLGTRWLPHQWNPRPWSNQRRLAVSVAQFAPDD